MDWFIVYFTQTSTAICVQQVALSLPYQSGESEKQRSREQKSKETKRQERVSKKHNQYIYIYHYIQSIYSHT